MIAGHRSLRLALWSAMVMVIAAIPAYGQIVNDLTDHNVTADELITVLAPKEASPRKSSSGTRGVSLVTSAYKHFHNAVAHGIELQP